MRTLRTVCLTTILVAATASAQAPGPGLTWTGTVGGAAGSFFPSCASLPVTALRGDGITLRVWGDPGSPFAVLAAAGTGPCLPIAGIGNGLVLDASVFPLAAGVLTMTTPCLSCPPGLQPLAFVVPTFLPIGTAASFQAVAFGSNQFAFTVGITATVP